MKKKILIVGASGTLGSAIAEALEGRHDIIRAGRSSGDVKIDMTDAKSILEAFKKIGWLDAVISAAGQVAFAPLADFRADPLGESLHTKGLTDKLMGQVNLALAARDNLNDGGSVTLTSGILSEQFIAQGSSASMVNNAVEGFVRAAAIEMPRGLRINAVSPSVFEESMKKYGAFFAGFRPVPVADAARAFVRSVEGLETGQVYKVF